MVEFFQQQGSTSSGTSGSSSSQSPGDGGRYKVVLAMKPKGKVLCFPQALDIIIKVTRDGQPAAGVPVRSYFTGDRTTDSDGIVRAAYTTEYPGVYAFFATAMVGRGPEDWVNSNSITKRFVTISAVRANGKLYNDGETIFTCRGPVGSTLRLEAVPTGGGDVWPPGQPRWQGRGVGAVLEVPADSASLTSDGASYTVFCCQQSLTVRVVVCHVDIEPAPIRENVPDISPNMCINAQPDYRRARWTATVYPHDATATVFTQGYSSNEFSGVVNNQDVEVTPTSGTGYGEYDITIVHDKAPGCKVQKGPHAVVKIDFKDISIVPGPTTTATPAGSATFKKTTAEPCVEPRTFETGITATLATGVGLDSISPFSQTVTWKYKLVAKPEGFVSGNVECPTTISTTIPSGMGAISATGIAAVKGIGLVTSSMKFVDAIDVKGLSGGDGSVHRDFAVDAPTSILIPFNAAVLSGTTTWTNDAAVYSIGGVVACTDAMTMSASRSWSTASASGYATNTGFDFQHGEYKIVE